MGFLVSAKMLSEGKHEVILESRSEGEKGQVMKLSGGRTFQAGGTASAKHPSRSIVGIFEELHEVQCGRSRIAGGEIRQASRGSFRAGRF